MYERVTPPRRRPADDRGYHALLVQAVFQAGFSWQLVREKWQGFEDAFRGFEIETVATFGPEDVDALMRRADIVRNRAKIEAVVVNARTCIDLQDRYGSLVAFFASIRLRPYRERVLELTSRFKYVGPTAAYFVLWCADEDVPDWGRRREAL